MPIVFARISNIVFPIPFGWNNGIPKILRISTNSWFIFNNHDASRGMLHEQGQRAVRDAGLAEKGIHRYGKILHESIPLHGDL